MRSSGGSVHTAGLARQPLPEESGCRTPYKLEPVLDEPGNIINAALGKANATLGEAGRLLHNAGCDALHASHGRL